MTTDRTLITQDFSPEEPSASDEKVPALAVLWFIDEPERVGEVALVPKGTLAVLGRSEPGAESDARRLRLVQQRPGRSRGTGPIRSPRISREQLHVEVDGKGVLHLHNVGRAAMAVNGTPAVEAEPKVGDLVEIRNRLILLVTERPMLLPEVGSGVTLATHRFGCPDEHGIVGESPVIWKLRERIAFVAARTPHVLVTGQSGTGKELVANAIHARSERSRKPMVSRNAATFPETLIDAELFGNLKDYPNPGMRERPGLIGEADGSTLFLDEIGELPSELQAHLLRVLDDGEYQRLGESRTRRSDFRLIGATNRPDLQLKDDFRARLEMRVDLPDLNSRTEDVPLLARHLLRRIASHDTDISNRFFVDKDPQGEPKIGPALLIALASHRYTTNVRELMAILWQSMASSTEGHLDRTPDLAAWLDERAVPIEAPEPPGTDVASLTREQIQACLDRHEGVLERVWRELGLKNRYQLYRLIKKYGLTVQQDPSLPGS